MTLADLSRELESEAETHRLRESEAFALLLRADLDSLRRLLELDRTMREGIRSGRMPFDQDLRDGLARQLRRWLERTRTRLRQLALQGEEALFPPEAVALRATLEDAEASLEEMSWAALGTKTRDPDEE